MRLQIDVKFSGNWNDLINFFQATPICRWSRVAAQARSTSVVWTMCHCTGPLWSLHPRPLTRSRASCETSYKHCSSRPTTSSRWNCSAQKKRWWRSASDRRRLDIGSFIRVVVSGRFLCLMNYFTCDSQQKTPLLR